MDLTSAAKAALQFGDGVPTIEQLGNGLINHSFLVRFANSQAIVLQAINTNTFAQPENIINNYRTVQDFLQDHSLPQPARLLATQSGKYYWIDADDNFWRATSYQENALTLDVPRSPADAFAAAKSFASFTRLLKELPAEKLNIIIPGFHDLRARYEQFENAIRKAPIKLLLKATHVISEIRDRLWLVDFYDKVIADPAAYPQRIMHHDCKISNILFDKITGAAIYPVDLDTLMPGHFFSDLGDMVRTMACTEDENSNSWETIGVRPAFYDAILKGYLTGMGGELTAMELRNIHHPGLLLTYMQCIRFVTDFLNNDIYYRTFYPEQNLNRALNQLILLEKIEEYIASLEG